MRRYYELNFVPPKKKTCWSPNLPGPQNITWFGKRVFCKCRQVKLRSLVRALIQHEWCSYKKRKFGHRDRCTEDYAKRHRENMWTRRQRQRWCIYKARSGKDCWQTMRSQERGREQMRPSVKPILPTPWSQTSGLQDCETTHFHCLSHPVCRTLL